MWVIWEIFPDGDQWRRRLLAQAYVVYADARLAAKVANAAEEGVATRYRHRFQVTPEPPDRAGRLGRVIVPAK